MAYKLIGKLGSGKFAIVKGDDGKYYVVDFDTSTTIVTSATKDGAYAWANMLENGDLDAAFFEDTGIGVKKKVDLSGSQGPKKPKDAAGDGKFSVVKVFDDDGNGEYALLKKDGKYHVVDVAKSQTLYFTKDDVTAEQVAIDLSKGYIPPSDLEGLDGYKVKIELPDELKKAKPTIKAAGDAKLKVVKNFDAFSVVKDPTIGKFYLVDVANSSVVLSSWSASTAKYYGEMLQNGSMTAEKIGASKYTKDYLTPIDMPKSLKAKQAQLAKQATYEAATGKPIGSTAPSVVDVIDKGPFKVVELSDGTYGVLVESTGESKLGLKTKGGATQSGKSLVKKHAASVLSQRGIDPGDDATDTLLGLYESRVREMYAQAAMEMADKEAAYLERFAKKDAEMAAKQQAGEITAKELKSWRSSQALIAAQNANMAEALAADLANADAKAMQMLNGYMPQAYAENYNYATFQIEKAANASTSFSLYNQDAIMRLAKNPDEALLPPARDVPKDMAWCREKVSSCIAQSILQGDSVPQAAERLRSVVGMGANSAVRAARTALTGASNLGRLDAGKRAKAMGIELEKQWVATVDNRTRHTHRQIDRETVELEEKFSNGCEYPGDPTAPGAEVWNCRCAMRFVLPGHEYDDLPEKSREGLEYEEWKNAKLAEQEAQIAKYQAQLDKIEAEKNKVKSVLPEDKSYAKGELLKHPTSLSKWGQEKAAIADSKAYCEKKLHESETKALTAHGSDKAYHAKKAKHYEDKLAALEKFDRDGRAYHEAHEAVKGQLEALDDQAKKIGAKIQKAKGVNSFSAERLAAGRKFSSSHEADAALRSISGNAWKQATAAERRAINTYTGNSYDEFNIPLNGYKGSYRNFVGLDKVDIDDLGRGQMTRDMTRIIEKSIMEEDIWVKRGVGTRTMNTFFGLDPQTDITSLSDAELKSFIGMSNRIGSFQSCGTTFSTGFTTKPVMLEVFVPKGAEAMYVEPISRFGDGDGIKWNGVSKQRYFSGELETILQRGGSYTCIDFKRVNGKPTFVLEVHPEDGYWKFQQ